jgi:hypothetical protein
VFDVVVAYMAASHLLAAHNPPTAAAHRLAVPFAGKLDAALWAVVLSAAANMQCDSGQSECRPQMTNHMRADVPDLSVNLAHICVLSQASMQSLQKRCMHAETARVFLIMPATSRDTACCQM